MSRSGSKVTVEPRGRSWRLRYRIGEDRRPSHSVPTEQEARYAAKLIDIALAARPNDDPWDDVTPLVAKYSAQLGLATADEPVKLPVDLQRSIPLRAYYQQWITTKVPPRCRVGTYRDHVRYATYYLPDLGDLQLAKITEDQIVRLRDKLLKVGGKRGTPLNVQTVRNIMSSLKRLFRDAMKPPLRITTTFPFGEAYRDYDVDREKRFKSKADPFTREEKLKLVTFLRQRWGKRQPHLAAYVIFQLYVPCRPSEASGLQWTDIDLANHRAYIRRSYHKGAYDLTKTALSDRPVVLPPEVVEVLRQLQLLHVEPEAPVFVNRDGKPIEPANFSPTWNSALRAAGIRARGLYAAKDTAVTHLRLAGCSWGFVERQSGVREKTLRRHYEGQLPEELPDEYEKLSYWDAATVAGFQPHPIQPQGKEAQKAS